jgi:hypothetical protein
MQACSTELEHFQQKCKAVLRPEMRLKQKLGASSSNRNGSSPLRYSARKAI